MGHTHVENFLSTLEVPVITQRTMRRKERNVYHHVKSIAEESCRAVLAEDIKKKG